MATGGTIDAAALARLREQQLTEIAQGDIPKLAESLVNRDLLPGALVATFQAAVVAVESEHHLKTLDIFTRQQQHKIEREEKAEEKKEKKARENWLEAMSPEYRQAYGDLMKTVDHADETYKRLRKQLTERGERLDQDAQEIDDKAIHLSDGSRAYVDGRGNLVDKNGAALKGKDAAEAQRIFQQRGGNPADFAQLGAYRQNEQRRAQNDGWLQRVNTENSDADNFRKNVAAGNVQNTAQVRQGNSTIQSKAAVTTSYVSNAIANDANANTTSLAGMPDLESAPAPASLTAGHGSFASTLDPSAGIHAKNVSASFTAAAQGVTPVVTAPSPSQKPAVSAPAPA